MPAASLRGKKRLHVFWSGRVQGVGFRYTAESEALASKISGWVRNCSDGRVEALCEGPEKLLKEFLEKVAQGPMRPYIQEAQVSWDEPTGEFDNFSIRFF